MTARTLIGRHATLIELNPDYVGLQRSHIFGDVPLIAEVVSHAESSCLVSLLPCVERR